MTSNPPATESFPPPAQWLDRLDDAAALALMLDSQGQAITAIKAALPMIEVAVGAALSRLEGGEGRLFYAGAGTSGRIGVQDGVELTPTFGWPKTRLGFVLAGGEAALLTAIEGAEDNAEAAFDAITAHNLSPADVMIGLSASGVTPFTCAAIAAAREKNALTIGIANNRDTPLESAAEIGIALITGGELVAGSTRMKAGTAQKICLNMITTLLMTRMGKVKNGMMIAMQASNAKLHQRQKRIKTALESVTPQSP